MFETSIWASLGASVGPGARRITAGLGDPTSDHPPARRHRGRLGQAVVRHVGALAAGPPVGRGLRELAAGVEGLPDRLAA
jgi:hypothetical protein